MSREIINFDISFKDPNAIYKAGDVVAGHVILDLGSELKLRGVRLCLQGVGRVNWDESRAYTKGSSSKVSHKNVDVYLDETIYLLRKTDGSGLAPGHHTWPFTLRIPPYLPASFEGQWGRVMYWAKAVIDRPWKGDNECSKSFQVLGCLDLNTDPDAKKPIEGVAEIMAGTMCCTSGPITGHISLQKRGYVPGQSVPFSVRLQNSSKKKLCGVRVQLSQQVTFRADKQVRKTNIMLKGLTKGDVAPGENIAWNGEVENIPSMPPSKLGGGCKNIEVKYLLSVVATPAGPGKSLEVPVEVILGTIPLRKTESGTPMLTVKAAARQLGEGGQDTVQLAKGAKGTGRSPRPSPRPSPMPQRIAK